jgi:hypothetical protein
VARPNIESSAAPAVQGTVEDHIQLVAGLLTAATGAAVAICPGILIGVAAAALWRWLKQPATYVRIAVAVALLVPFLALRSLVETAWLWRDMLANALPSAIKGVDGGLVFRSLPVEALAGPLALELFSLAILVQRRTINGQVRRDHRLDKQQWRAISGHRGPTERLKAMRSHAVVVRSAASYTHPRGFVRLGLDAEINQPLDLKLPDEFATHVFMPGASGGGKTTTIARLADGALANGYSAIFIDCKGSGLGDTARALAERYGLPFFLVDPDDPTSLGYNPCSGDASSVANKLVGAFTYSPAAEIYKNIAMEAVPVVARGLMAAGKRVTLEALYDAFGTRGFTKLAQAIPTSGEGNDRLKKRLLDLGSASQADRVSKSGFGGFQHRLGALLEGKFGELFRSDDVLLDWGEALAQPSVTYVALSTLASNEDVELFGRVIAQDLKQVCSHRLRALRRGDEVIPALAVFDEFAALQEAEQLADLGFQAREARMPLVISTQYIPQTIELRKVAMSAGLILAHRVEAEDAEAIADQFGTRKRSELTHQVDFGTGYAEKGSIRRVDAYNVNPNVLRTLKIGRLALRSVHRERHAIVNVYRDRG